MEQLASIGRSLLGNFSLLQGTISMYCGDSEAVLCFSDVRSSVCAKFLYPPPCVYRVCTARGTRVKYSGDLYSSLVVTGPSWLLCSILIDDNLILK